MAATGYLDASAMANAFNMLRPDDLIWSYVVNNYLKGKAPLAFDLLAWNSDSTRMPAANHLTYLRHCYLENRLAKGKAKFGGKILDLSKVTIPVYHLATQRGSYRAGEIRLHRRQACSAATSATCSPVPAISRASSIRSPSRNIHIGRGRPVDRDFEDWLATAIEHKGSWWVDWIGWIKRQSPEKVPARIPGDHDLAPLCDAPGDYVRVRY